MSNTLIKVFQREHGNYGYDRVQGLTFPEQLNTGRTTLNDGGEVYVLQPFTTTLGDSCELVSSMVTINNAAATLESQSQLANATDLLQVRITQLPQVESQQTVVAPLDAETLTHLLSRDVVSRSVVEAPVVTTDPPKSLDEAGTTALWVPNEGKESEANFADVGLVPVMLGDNLFYINTSQAIDNIEPVVTQIVPELPANVEGDVPLDTGNTVLSFVVDHPDQLSGMLPLSKLHQAPVVSNEVPRQVVETSVPRAKLIVKLKPQMPAKAIAAPNKTKNGRSLLKGSVTAKQARTVPARTNLCLNKVKKGYKTIAIPPILQKNLNTANKVNNPKMQVAKNGDLDTQQGNQQQSLAVVAISSDKAKDLTEIIVNTSKGKQVFKGKTSDLINAMSALRSASGDDDASSENQGDIVEPNNESSEAEDEEEDEDDCDDQPVQDALEKLGTSLDNLLTVQDHLWKCPEPNCNRVFHRLHVLKIHILNHYGVRPYKCDYPRCKWAFFTHYRLKRHSETHLKRKDFKCPNCDRSFTTIYNVKTHQKLHQRPAIIECPVPECCSRFQTKRHLELHMREHGTDHAPFKCPVSTCDKRYYSLNAVNSHVRSHQHKENDLQCQWAGCKKIFDRPCRLQAHIRSHTGDKPYRCNYQNCGWAFASSSKLKRHQQKHTNTRNFACSVEGCGKTFMRPEHLREHVLTHSCERPFQCTYNNCGFRFTAKSSLYVHMKKHRAQSDASADPAKTAIATIMATPRADPHSADPLSAAALSAVAAATPRADPHSAAATAASTSAATPTTRTDPHSADPLSADPLSAAALCPTATASAQPTETRILYYCPVEDCETSVCTMADIRSHILEVHSPLLTQGDLMQLMSGLNPISFDIGSNPHEANVQPPDNDGMVSVVQLSGPVVINSNETSVLNEFLTIPHLTQQHTVDPLLSVEPTSQETSNECGALLLGTSEMKSTEPSRVVSEPNLTKEDSGGSCARTISYQTWRLTHPSRNAEITCPDEAMPSLNAVSCVTDVPGLSELRVPSDVVLGGALLGTAHDNIAQFLLSEDLGSSALYDSEEGMLTMDSPFEPSTINLRDLE